MQKRHTDREQYFKELAATCKKYYIPFLDKETSIGRGTKVLEIGCGDGGNLLPFLECGCDVTGIEISPTRISQAKSSIPTYFLIVLGQNSRTLWHTLGDR